METEASGVVDTMWTQNEKKRMLYAKNKINKRTIKDPQLPFSRRGSFFMELHVVLVSVS